MGTTAMNLAISIAQIASPVLYAAFIVVIYFQLKSGRESVQEVRQEFLAAGRPVVAVHDEYDTTSQVINLVVENVGQGPAKDVNFEFSRPIECSDGVVISALPLFTVGLTSLSPAARITCYWDDFGDLMASLREQGLEGNDFEVTVRYSDLTGAVYANNWDIQPAIYQGLRNQPSQHNVRATHDGDHHAREKTDGPKTDWKTDELAGHDTEPSTTETPTGPTGPTGAVAGPARGTNGSSPEASSS